MSTATHTVHSCHRTSSGECRQSEMMQRLGDEKGRDVLREHERITRETLKEYAGAEVKTMGNGFIASFG